MMGKWIKTGGFGDDYSNVMGATVKKHLGEDWVYRVIFTNKTYGADIRAVENGFVVDLGGNINSTSGKGVYIRIESEKGGRVDYFHLSEIFVQKGQIVSKGEVIALGGSSGSGPPHLHIAKSYPQGQAPINTKWIIDYSNRSYVTPPELTK